MVEFHCGNECRLPGFRPGKAPLDLVRARFAADIREEVIKSLLPKHFQKRVEDQDLHVAGTPDITDVHLHAGEPMTFKAEFEVAPDIELKEYRGLTVAYREPEVTGEQVAERLEHLRDQKAEFVNVDPRPVSDGDYAVLSLEAQGQVDGEPAETGRAGGSHRRRRHAGSLQHEPSRPHSGRGEGV